MQSSSVTSSGTPITHHSLRSDCLSYLEVLAQSVSLIAPSTVPGAILGLIFLTAGNGAWLSFLIGMIGLVLVSLNINQFARRSASSGSLYSFIVQGLGPTAGILGGWALLFGYMLTGMSTLAGFAIVAGEMLKPLGYEPTPSLLYAVGASLACLLAFRDVIFSARAMLAFEGAALVAVLALGFIVWQHSNFAIDTEQVMLTNVSPGGVLAGVALVVFGFSGFESSTSLGEEAKDPLRTIPRSVIQSVVSVGIIFMFMTYAVVLGFRDLGVDLGKSESPLLFLATALGWKKLGVFINLGILLSFFSCTLSSINATSRIVYAMARHGLVNEAFGAAHKTHDTPHLAVLFASLLTFLVTLALYLLGATPFQTQGYLGTLCSFGFLLTYVLVSLAAPLYLRRIGKLDRKSVFYAVTAVAFMIVPFVGVIGIPGSTLFPPPSSPDNLLIWVFIAYMAVGAIWLYAVRARNPEQMNYVARANRSPADEVAASSH